MVASTVPQVKMSGLFKKRKTVAKVVIQKPKPIDTKKIIKETLDSYVSRNAMTKVKIAGGSALANLTSGTIYTFNALGNISIGTGETARLGSEIKIKDIRLTALVRADASALNTGPVFIRILWVRTQNSTQAGVDTFASGLGVTNLFMEGQTVALTAQTDPDRVTVLSDAIVKFDKGLANPNDQAIIYADCPQKNFVFKYATATSGYSVINKNVYCVIVMDSYAATAGTTIMGDFGWSSTVRFADGGV